MKVKIKPWHYALAIWLLVSPHLILSVFAADGIATDGTVGPPARILSAPNAKAAVVIQQTDGTTFGPNLFHSFSKFNIESEQLVIFTENSPNTLDNVISRVTGGSSSEINGHIWSTPGGHADFYLINPAGVLFGPKAQIHVPAAFHVSTADELKFQDGGKYSASQPSASILSAAAPAAFGFLGTSSANNALIDINGSQLGVSYGKNLDLVAGDIRIKNQAYLAAWGGGIRLVAMHGNGTASIGRGLPLPESASLAGNILIDNSFLDTSGNGGGRIVLGASNISLVDSYAYADNVGEIDATSEKGIHFRSHSLNMNNSQVTSDAYEGTGDAGNVTVEADGSLKIVNGGGIKSYSWTPGNAGTVKVTAGTLTINRMGSSKTTSIRSDARAGSGNAGPVFVNAKTINLLNGGAIGSTTSTTGDAGNVAVTANTVNIDGQGSNDFTGIATTSQYGKDGSGGGNAGSLTVNARTLLIQKNGQISSSTETQGNAAPISITADSMTINNQGASVGSGVLSQAAIGSGGNASNVTIQAGTLEILNKNSQISSGTDSTGHAGDVSITANTLKLDGGGEQSVGIRSSTGGSGDAGNINVRAESLEILNGSGISSATDASGGAGNVTVKADTITIGKNAIISSSSRGANSSGRIGNIAITANDWFNLSSGSVSSENEANITDANLASSITPGSIRVSARDIAMQNGTISARSSGNVAAGSIVVKCANTLSLNSSLITTEANAGNGGSINVNGDQLIRLQDSGFKTTVHGSTGNGGNINVAADILLMETGLIQANTAARGASGGNITLSLKSLIPSGNMLTIGGTDPIDWQPGIFGMNVIQAAAPGGLNGIIRSSAPRLNISGELAYLGSPQFDNSVISPDYCALGSGSSLTLTGKGGLMPKGSDWSAY